MRYLITGGAGFIGSHTVDEAVRRGHSVMVLDDLSSGREENLAAVRREIHFLHGSVTDRDVVERACQGVDCVIHLAARTSVPQSIAEPLGTHRVNVDGTLNVLLAARDAGVRRVVFASSCAVYGEAPRLSVSEETPPRPLSPYAASKLVGELYGHMFHRVYRPEFVTLRYFNVFGPRQDRSSQYSGVLSRFCAALCEGGGPVVYGDGEQSRDFVYVEDVAQANLLACETSGIAGTTFNIGTGERQTLNQTLKLLQKFAGRPANARYEAARAGDIRHSQADISLARQKLGFVPAVGFEEGLRKTWNWYCPNLSVQRSEGGVQLPDKERPPIVFNT